MKIYTNSQTGLFIDWINVHASHVYSFDVSLIFIYNRNYVYLFYFRWLSSKTDEYGNHYLFTIV